MNATECLLEDVQLAADSRNDEVLRSVLAELEQEHCLDSCCAYCWTKIAYVETKLQAHRIKKKLNWDDAYGQHPSIVFSYDAMSINLAALRGKAKELRGKMNASICICRGQIWNRYGRPSFG